MIRAIADPYPEYRRLGAEGPVHRDPASGAWLVLSHAEALAVLRDPERFSSEGTPPARLDRAPAAFVESSARWLFFQPPEPHARLRAWLAPLFAPAALEALHAAVDAAVAAAVGALVPGEPNEVVSGLAWEAPARVLASLLAPAGAAGAAWLEDAGRATRGDSGALERLVARAGALARGDGDPPAGPVARLADSGRAAFGDQTVAAQLLMLQMAGTEPTQRLIALGLHHLLEQTGRPAELPAGAVDELARYDAPVQAVTRCATRALRLGGRRVRAGDLVLVVVGAANRDPARFADPDRLELSRRDNPHLSLGHGPHHCPGAGLARVIAHRTFAALFARFPRTRRQGAPEWDARDLLTRGLKRLVIVPG